MPRSGVLLCLVSAIAFGCMAAVAKQAYGEGANVATLLAVRFSVAAVAFWALAHATGGLGVLRTAGRRVVGAGVLLGAAGYALQAGGYFAALERMDASVVALVLYSYPALVMVGAVALGREAADRRRVGALLLASGGLVLVVAGAGAGALDAAGVALAAGAAMVYATYILVSDGVVAKLPPFVLSALVCSGAAVSISVVCGLAGSLEPGALSAAGWGWAVVLAMVCTVLAIATFFAGLRRVGPSAASILSALEPVVTVVSVWVVFGEALTALQVAGGGLVLAAVLALQAGAGRGADEEVPDVGVAGLDVLADERADVRDGELVGARS